MIARLPLFLILSHTTAFQLHAPSKGTSFIRLDARNPSKVEDVGRGIVEEDVEEEAEFELVDPEDIEELKYKEQAPNPAVPWRRGDPDGCDDPMDAPWRIEGEQIIHDAAASVGATVEAVTWGMAMCTVTISDTSGVKKDAGEYLEERRKRDESYQYMREDREAVVTEDAVDMSGISVVAGTIIEALQEAEDRDVDVLSRHEIIVTSPGVSNVLETQKQFDSFKGFDVIVQTIDPLGSNRILEGKLLERTALDTFITQKGKKVTIPNNFIDYVELPKAKREKGDNYQF